MKANAPSGEEALRSVISGFLEGLSNVASMKALVVDGEGGLDLCLMANEA